LLSVRYGSCLVIVIKIKFQPFKTCANSAFVKHNGWRINKDYSILFYSILIISGTCRVSLLVDGISIP
jgi:hypothetical protein